MLGFDLEKSWKILNLQADTILQLALTKTEVWKVAVGGMAAGGADEADWKLGRTRRKRFFFGKKEAKNFSRVRCTRSS